MKNRNGRTPRLVVLGVSFLISLCFIFGNEVAAGTKKKISCTDLTAAFSYPNTTLTSVTPQAAGPVTVSGIVYNLPDHCVVQGKMNERVGPIDNKPYAIGFEMRLPTSWNGRFLYQANGGIDGSVVPAYGTDLGGGPRSNGLIRGFAVISSDAGHQPPAPFFGIDPQARLDYGYNAVAQLTPMAKRLIMTYYGKKPYKSYLYGCSNGGRHAMVAASRYADQYDGILAGNPGFNLPQAAVSQLWGAQQYYTITTPDITISNSFTPTEFSLVGNAILDKCDALDGLVDDMVTNPLKCQSAFDLDEDVPTCSGARDGTCLTAVQKTVLADIIAGAKNSSGEPLYTNFLWDVGIKGSNWAFWEFFASMNLDPGAVAFIFGTPPESPVGFNGLNYALNLGGTGFNPDVDAPKIFDTFGPYTESSMSFMTPPDLTMSGLFEHKSKLLVFHGTADAVFSPADTINWYEGFQDTWGGRSKTAARLFLVPQMNHCSGGPSCDQFDMLKALVKWVEQGPPPNSIVAKARGIGANAVNPEVPATWAPDRTRLLCPYPGVAKYSGRGSIEDAASFKCVFPKECHNRKSNK
jgi:pimeloyl-ACP methyl ester carboxylesterase